MQKKQSMRMYELGQVFPPVAAEWLSFLNEAEQAYDSLKPQEPNQGSTRKRLHQSIVTSFVLNFQNALIKADSIEDTSFFNANKEKIRSLYQKLDSLKTSITERDLLKAINEIDSIMLKRLPQSSIPTLPNIDNKQNELRKSPNKSKEAEEFMQFLPAEIDSIKKNFLSDEGWITFGMQHGFNSFNIKIDYFLKRLDNALQTAKDDSDSDFLIRHKDTLDQCQECLKGINDKLQLPAEQLEQKYGVNKDNQRSWISNWESLITNINAKIAERPDNKPKVSKKVEEFMRFLPSDIDFIKNTLLSDEGWRTFIIIYDVIDRQIRMFYINETIENRLHYLLLKN